MNTPIFVLVALTLPLTATASPQSGPASPVQRMVSQLNATAEQKAKLDPILAEDAKLVRALRDSGLSAGDQARKKAEIRAATDEKIKPILTGDQWGRLQELRAEDAKTKGAKKKK